MARHHASPGEIVDLNTWTIDLPNEHTKAVVKTDKMELIRLVIPSGKEIPTHKVSGSIIVHCIKGAIEFIAMKSRKKLMPGQLLYLMPHEAHSVRAIKDSVVLLVIIF